MPEPQQGHRVERSSQAAYTPGRSALANAAINRLLQADALQPNPSLFLARARKTLTMSMG